MKFIENIYEFISASCYFKQALNFYASSTLPSQFTDIVYLVTQF